MMILEGNPSRYRAIYPPSWEQPLLQQLLCFKQVDGLVKFDVQLNFFPYPHLHFCEVSGDSHVLHFKKKKKKKKRKKKEDDS